MYKTLFSSIICLLISGFSSTIAQPEQLAAVNENHHHIKPLYNSLIKMTIKTNSLLSAGESNKVYLTLTDGQNNPVTFEQIKTTHEEKIHVLILDSNFDDYHHKHPQPTDKLGEYVLEFTPKTTNSYKLWADITLKKPEQQIYLVSELKGLTDKIHRLRKDHKLNYNYEGFTFRLNFSNSLEAGKVAEGKLEIMQEGKPFTKLQPIMGTFAHIVGFSEDFFSLSHVHPNEEPKGVNDLGGPVLTFHIIPEKEGLLKLFAQVKINSQEIFVPFVTYVMSPSNYKQLLSPSV